MIDGAPAVNGSVCLIYSVSDIDPSDGLQCLQCEADKIWDIDTGYYGDCVGKS